MRKIFLVILLIWFSTNNSNLVCQQTTGYEWVEVTNIPDSVKNNYWLDVFVLPANPNYVWISGFDGKVLLTTDNGETWRVSDSSLSENIEQLESIYFANELVGYVSGNDAVFKSTDGGLSWQKVLYEDWPKTIDVWGISFLNADYGVAFGGGCFLDGQSFSITTDGGKTWKINKYQKGETGLSDGTLFPDGTGYASSSGRIWQTLDSGKNWEIIVTFGEENWQEDIAVNGPTILIPFAEGCDGGTMLGEGGVIISSNFGKNWDYFTTNEKFYGCFLLDEKSGWGVGYQNNVFYTPNAGLNWIKSTNGIDSIYDFDDIWFSSDTSGWLVGEKIYKFTGRINVVSDVDENITLTNDILITPNPVSDDFKLDFNLSTTTEVEIRIVNTTGEIIYKENLGLLDTGKNSILISIPEISRGVYFLQMITNGDCKTEEFIKF